MAKTYNTCQPSQCDSYSPCQRFVFCLSEFFTFAEHSQGWASIYTPVEALVKGCLFVYVVSLSSSPRLLVSSFPSPTTDQRVFQFATVDSFCNCSTTNDYRVLGDIIKKEIHWKYIAGVQTLYIGPRKLHQYCCRTPCRLINQAINV